MRAGVLAMLRFMDDEPGLARICVVEALGAGPRVLKRRTEVLVELKEVIDEGRCQCRRPRGARVTDEAPEVTAEGVIGAVFAVLHSRLLAHSREPFTALLGPLMSMIVLPYLGARAVEQRAERARRPRCPSAKNLRGESVRHPIEGLDMRLTYRTVRVLTFIGEHPRRQQPRDRRRRWHRRSGPDLEAAGHAWSGC